MAVAQDKFITRTVPFPVVVRTAFALVTLALVLLAGCTEPPAEPADPGPVLPSLDRFSGCPWEYPDNTSVDCEPGAAWITPEEEIPPAWVCTDEDREEGWSLHWNPATNEYGLWVEIPENATGQDGVMRLNNSGEEHLFQWEEAPQTAFLRFPVELEDTVSFRYALHEFGYAVNGTLLSESEPTPVWSLHKSQFWVVHRFDTSNGTYTFQNMTVTEFRFEGADRGQDERESFYEVPSFEVLGEDFALWVHHERGHLASSQGLADALVVDRFCMTGLG